MKAHVREILNAMRTGEAGESGVATSGLPRGVEHSNE
jgi:hypothetical protein